jgi:hypothetical protein
MVVVVVPLVAAAVAAVVAVEVLVLDPDQAAMPCAGSASRAVTRSSGNSSACHPSLNNLLHVFIFPPSFSRF